MIHLHHALDSRHGHTHGRLCSSPGRHSPILGSILLGRVHVTRQDYNQQVSRCVTAALALTGQDKAKARQACSSMILSGFLMGWLAGSPSMCIDMLLFSGAPHAGDTLGPRPSLADAAAAAFMADVQASIGV